MISDYGLVIITHIIRGLIKIILSQNILYIIMD